MLNRWTSSWRIAGEFLLVLSAVSIVATAVPVSAQATSDRPVTFAKDVAPILQRKCQQCHRPESIAPMSLITYEQVRPYARAIKQRTQMAYVPGMRGIMPPWPYERNIGIQKLRDDMSLSDAEIATLAKWADSGAAQGDPADMPPPLTFADNSVWFRGKPDLIVDSPRMFVKGVGPDWWGEFGDTPSVETITEDRYASGVEYKEVSDVTLLRNAPGYKAAIGSQGKVALVVFHHGGAAPRRPGGEPEASTDPEAVGNEGSLARHEVGRNGDVFPADAGKLVPAKAIFAWDGHIHSPGVPGADRYAVLRIGIRFHPKGYAPKYSESGIQAGSTEIEIATDSDNQRYDTYWVAPRPFKLLNFEPHMHATGVRMCMEAIYKRSIETLSCAGYDHNWVRNYQYDDNVMPLLPKGTILHLISWFDGTSKNANNIDPRNTTVWGRRSAQNMLGAFNKVNYLTDEQYVEELEKRREYLDATKGWNTVIGCPGCLEQQQAPRRGSARAN
jgi:hypothetical protein